MDSVAEVTKNINTIYDKKRLAVLALCKYYAKLCIQDFRALQEQNHYWTNQTGFAKDTMFTTSFTEDNVVGFLMAHSMPYGVQLELDHDKQYAAIAPTINKFLPQFKADLKRLY